VQLAPRARLHSRALHTTRSLGGGRARPPVSPLLQPPTAREPLVELMDMKLELLRSAVRAFDEKGWAAVELSRGV